MTKSVACRATGVFAAVAVVASLSLGGCAALMAPPGPKNVAGLSPDGTVALGEHFVAGLGEGGGTLTYQGQTYPFTPRRFCRRTRRGPVPDPCCRRGPQPQSPRGLLGAYTQGTGPAGLDTSKAGDLWLRNRAGVIMHLTGSSSGVMLSLAATQSTSGCRSDVERCSRLAVGKDRGVICQRRFHLHPDQGAAGGRHHARGRSRRHCQCAACRSGRQNTERATHVSATTCPRVCGSGFDVCSEHRCHMPRSTRFERAEGSRASPTRM